MVNRLLTRAELSAANRGPTWAWHWSYTNCTSPLRKYLDFSCTCRSRHCCTASEPTLVDAELLADSCPSASARSRTATLEAERWLASKLPGQTARRADRAPTFKATGHPREFSSGFNVRLDDNGLEGFRRPAQGSGEVQLRQVDCQPDQHHPPLRSWTTGGGP